ncbi:MAG TPA: sigma-70 family RNA polymerase sigma factor [Chloroflexota bacterium]|jgi:RNA polymerase sigma-70 factor (ECF subfamily)
MPLDEQEAVRRLQQGDVGGLEPLVHAYYARAVGSAYLVTRDRALAYDVTQAAFVKAYERIGQLDPGRPFGPWFLKTVLRDAVKAAVRRQRQLPLSSVLTDGDEYPIPVGAAGPLGPEALLEQQETAAAVAAVLATLPPADRAVIVQRYYLELSEAEMAAALGCPRGTIKSRLHAARERLRELLRPLITHTEAS